MDAGGNIAENGDGEHTHSALIILGSGCSSAVPNAMCLIQPSDPPCQVCFQSLSIPPERNPNYRCNTSLLIDYCPSVGEHKYILIDVGKTFREQVLRWFTFHKIPQVDSVIIKQHNWLQGEQYFLETCSFDLSQHIYSFPTYGFNESKDLGVSVWRRDGKIVLTHEHADAVLGLDDIRTVQPFSPVNDIDPTPIYLNQHSMERTHNSNTTGGRSNVGTSKALWQFQEQVQVYLSHATRTSPELVGENVTTQKESMPRRRLRGIHMAPTWLPIRHSPSIKVKFPYLVQKKLQAGQEVRRVAQLDWKIIENDCKRPFVASGLEIVPLPVMHGEDYICLGFAFGRNCKVAYISDISRFIEDTELYISNSEGRQLDLLILDTLYKTGAHNTHFCFPQTLEALKKLQPKQALLIGMTHEFDHHKDNEFLEDWSKREGIPVQLAHDGLRIPVDL